jgi:hypothetical protein
VLYSHLPRLGATGATLAGSPIYELQPDYGHRDVVLEISDGYGVIARWGPADPMLRSRCIWGFGIEWGLTHCGCLVIAKAAWLRHR